MRFNDINRACAAPVVPAGGFDRTTTSPAEPTPIATIPKSTGGALWKTVGRGARWATDELGIPPAWKDTVTKTGNTERHKIIDNTINLGAQGVALDDQIRRIYGP